MKQDDERVEHVFLVRMWREPGGPTSQWRGSVQHVATGRRLFVGSPGEVGDFITMHCTNVARRAQLGGNGQPT